MKGLPQIAALSIAAASLIAAVPPAAQTKQDREDDRPHNRPRLDPDDAYKNHCMRCHMATPQYSSGRMQTIVMHMRVRANLTQEETDAILQYLTLGEDSGGQEGPQSNERFQKDTRDSPAPAAGTALEQPAATQEAPVTPRPPAAEEPLPSQNPPATREPLAAQESPAAREPLASQKPPATRKPLAIKEAPVIHEPPVSQEPPATSEPLATREPPAHQPPTAQRPLDTGEALAARERPAAATVQRRTASTGPAPAAESYIEAGFAAFQTRRFEQAEIEFRKAVETDPTSTSARFYLGYTVGMIWMGSQGGGKRLRATRKPGTPTRATVQEAPSTGTALADEQGSPALAAGAYELDAALRTASPALPILRITLKNGSEFSLKEPPRPSGNRMLIRTTDAKFFSVARSEIQSITTAPSAPLPRLDTHDSRQLGAIARHLRKGKPALVAAGPGTPPLASVLSSEFEEPQTGTVHQ